MIYIIFYVSWDDGREIISHCCIFKSFIVIISILKLKKAVDFMLENLLLFSAVFLAFFIKRIVGFGNALILGSLLAYVKPTQFTTALDLMLVFPINIYMVWRERKGLNIKTTLPLLISTLVGSTIGIVLLNVSYDRILKVILGLVIIAVAVKLILKKEEAKEKSTSKECVLCAVSGLLLGLYGIAALLGVQMQNIFNDKEKYRANLCLILAVDNVYRIFMYLFSGIINREVLMNSGFALPAALGAVVCGSIIDKKIDAEIIKKLVIALLLISGLTIFFMNMLG